MRAIYLPILFLTSMLLSAIVVGKYESIWLSVPFLIVAMVALADIRARLREYLSLRGFKLTPRLVRRLRKSACQREVAKAIADYQSDPNCTTEGIKKQYNLWGYKWWYVFPEGFPKKIFTKAWWKTLI